LRASRTSSYVKRSRRLAAGYRSFFQRRPPVREHRRAPNHNHLERIAYNEVPPRVEYRVTPFGAKFIRILDELEKLQSDVASDA
jgi:HxlR-like helix-turn-helix